MLARLQQRTRNHFTVRNSNDIKPNLSVSLYLAVWGCGLEVVRQFLIWHTNQCSKPKRNPNHQFRVSSLLKVLSSCERAEKWQTALLVLDELQTHRVDLGGWGEGFVGAS